MWITPENFFQVATSEQSPTESTLTHGQAFTSDSSLTNTFQAGLTNLYLLAKASEIPNREVWDAHTKAKTNLLTFVEKTNGVKLDPQALTIGFARRATGYKRSTLIFSDLHRLTDINRKEKIQMIFAGKAHPKDTDGKKLIRQIHDYANILKDQISIVYLENYNMDIAAKLTSGVDVWLNTPLPPLEASGTSGMKAAHNGVINFSVLDGWWMEGCIEGVTGWAIGPHPTRATD